MRIHLSAVFPPIPTRNYDWECYDPDTVDGDYDYEAGRFVATYIRGFGPTEEAAIIDFVQNTLWHFDVNVRECWSRKEQKRRRQEELEVCKNFQCDCESHL